MQGEAGAADDAPDVVELAVVRRLMRDGVSEERFVARGLRREVYRGVDKAEEAGRIHRF